MTIESHFVTLLILIIIKLNMVRAYEKKGRTIMTTNRLIESGLFNINGVNRKNKQLLLVIMTIIYRFYIISHDYLKLLITSVKRRYFSSLDYGLALIITHFNVMPMIYLNNKSRAYCVHALHVRPAIVTSNK